MNEEGTPLRRSERIAAKNPTSEQSASRKRSGSHLETVLAKRRRNSTTSKTAVGSSPNIEISPGKSTSPDDFVNRIYRRAKRRKEAVNGLPVVNSGVLKQVEAQFEERDLRGSNKENQLSPQELQHAYVQVNNLEHLDAKKMI